MEFVYVVKRYDLFNLEFPHGFHLGNHDGSLPSFLERMRSKGFFIERRFTEEDSGFKQIIPYTLITHGNRVLLLKRTSEQGEARLHNKLSIGVGGHINPVDRAEDVLLQGCFREIEEEIFIEEDFEPVPVGYINDESNAVGSVHFGVVFIVRLNSDRVQVKETSMMTGEFMEWKELKKMASSSEYNFESWSSLIIQSPDLDSRFSG